MARAEEHLGRRTALRVGACGGLAGAILLLVSNATHPRPARAEVGDHEAFLRLAADSDAWIPIHLGILFGAVLFLAGLTALALALQDGRGAWLARLALVAAIVGTAVSVVQHSLDTAYVKVADDWASATGADKETLARVAGALEDVDFTMLSVNIVVLFGATFILFGLAASHGDVVPPALAPVAVAAGVAAVVVGTAQVFTGPSDLTLFVFPAIAAVLSLWVLVACVLVWRRSGVEPDAGVAAARGA